jgi:uncharacterized membrane protein
MSAGVMIWSSSGRTAPAVRPAQLVGSLDSGSRLMLAGIVLLAITPALEVLALVALWVRERAWRFAATAALVLLLLITALWLGGT